MSQHRSRDRVAAPPSTPVGRPRTRACALCTYTFAHVSMLEREANLHSHYMRVHYLAHRRELDAGAPGIL